MAFTLEKYPHPPVEVYALQDEHQQARCWFGAAISQQMQQEHETALQSLDIAERLSSQLVKQSAARSKKQSESSSSDDSSSSDEDDSTPTQTVHSRSLDSSHQNSAALAVKILLAKASILKQLKRTKGASECKKCAKTLDPAVS